MEFSSLKTTLILEIFCITSICATACGTIRKQIKIKNDEKHFS